MKWWLRRSWILSCWEQEVLFDIECTPVPCSLPSSPSFVWLLLDRNASFPNRQLNTDHQGPGVGRQWLLARRVSGAISLLCSETNPKIWSSISFCGFFIFLEWSGWNKRKIKHNHCLKIRICLLTRAAPCVGWEVGEVEVVVAVCECLWNVIPVLPSSESACPRHSKTLWDGGGKRSTRVEVESCQKHWESSRSSIVSPPPSCMCSWIPTVLWTVHGVYMSLLFPLRTDRYGRFKQ